MKGFKGVAVKAVAVTVCAFSVFALAPQASAHHGPRKKICYKVLGSTHCPVDEQKAPPQCPNGLTDMQRQDRRQGFPEWMSLTCVDLSYANLQGLEITDAHWRANRWLGNGGMQARYARFDYANLRGVNFKKSPWRTNNEGGKRSATGASFHSTDLTGATLVDVDLRDTDFTYANLIGADLSDSDFRGADITKAKLRNATFARATMTGVDMFGVDLRGADLQGADLRGADLRWADLRGADVTGADLRGADLCRAKLDGVNLSRAKTTVQVCLFS